MEEGKSVLNSPYSVWLNQSTIDVTLQSEVVAAARWKFAPHAATPALLPTRFQRKDCDHQFCEEQQQEVWKHEFYAWVDAPEWRQLLVTSRPPMTLCFVGSSHSRLLAQYAQHIDKSKVVKYQFIEAKYLKDVNIDRLYGTDDKHSEACTHVIIGASQWSVSWAQHSSPYTADRFQREIHELLKLFSQHKAFDPRRLYLRTTNYNSLGSFITSCPPFDFRSPPVIDALNRVLSEAAADSGIGFLDLSHIVCPLWDAALDYCHSLERVYVAQVQWLLYKVLSSAET